jgi:hypothetical protein
MSRGFQGFRATNSYRVSELNSMQTEDAKTKNVIQKLEAKFVSASSFINL